MAPAATSEARSWGWEAAPKVSEEKMIKRANKLKGEVCGLFEACRNVVEKLDLVDVLQRLGIDRHFQEQIATTLSSIHRDEFNSSNLHEAALRFRLLRQHGFWVPADEFDKFKLQDGSFIDSIADDPKGLLSLYNAANLLTYNEGALEEALVFARRHLELIQSSLESPSADQVARGLKIPLPRTLKRVEAVPYMQEYSVEQRYNPTILELAKPDFNLLQRLHQKELKTISHVDMKKFFLKVIRNFEEFEDELEPHEKYRVGYARKAFQLISKSYLQEAEWSHHEYIPSFNDHVNVSTISAGAQVMCVGSLVGMGDVATKEAFEWAIGNTDAIRASGEVSRFMDDMADFKEGTKWMWPPTSVECYMKEHNVTGEVALAKIGSFVDDAWKTLNQALFEKRSSLPVLQRVTNFAMSIMIIFLDQRDGYTNSKELKETLESQFVKHIPL
ncbi:hypothetical protein C2845_PM01G14960 [Panicum miliaceum]|uniref:Uncharacterized protein n=1 Tax=Panicum miliaceum TaxID=4540 RepID=A0A3L6TR84_PANMI|nr:hypothetical protein C2845_PM01G14960 [Panicum miliaceum]